MPLVVSSQSQLRNYFTLIQAGPLLLLWSGKAMEGQNKGGGPHEGG
jgi:hypothetical protein